SSRRRHTRFDCDWSSDVCSSDLEVLTTLHDHYSTHESLRLATERSGASLRKVALYEDPAKATVGGMAGAIEHALAPATRYVAIKIGRASWRERVVRWGGGVEVKK